jgi:hypothetical protein
MSDGAIMEGNCGSIDLRQQRQPLASPNYILAESDKVGRCGARMVALIFNREKKMEIILVIIAVIFVMWLVATSGSTKANNEKEAFAEFNAEYQRHVDAISDESLKIFPVTPAVRIPQKDTAVISIPAARFGYLLRLKSFVLSTLWGGSEVRGHLWKKLRRRSLSSMRRWVKG